MVATPAVIGACTVGRDRSSKLGDSKDGDVVPFTLGNHLGLKGAQRRIDLAEQQRRVPTTIRVGIEGAVLDKEDLPLSLQGVLRANHFGGLLELLANRVVGVEGLGQNHSVQRVTELRGAGERRLRQAARWAREHRETSAAMSTLQASTGHRKDARTLQDGTFEPSTRCGPREGFPKDGRRSGCEDLSKHWPEEALR